MSHRDEWPSMSDGNQYDGKQLLHLVRTGNSPFHRVWDVKLLIREIEQNLNVQVTNILTVEKGSNNYNGEESMRVTSGKGDLDQLKGRPSLLRAELASRIRAPKEHIQTPNKYTYISQFCPFKPPLNQGAGEEMLPNRVFEDGPMKRDDHAPGREPKAADISLPSTSLSALEHPSHSSAADGIMSDDRFGADKGRSALSGLPPAQQSSPGSSWTLPTSATNSQGDDHEGDRDDRYDGDEATTLLLELCAQGPGPSACGSCIMGDRAQRTLPHSPANYTSVPLRSGDNPQGKELVRPLERNRKDWKTVSELSDRDDDSGSDLSDTEQITVVQITAILVRISTLWLGDRSVWPYRYIIDRHLNSQRRRIAKVRWKSTWELENGIGNLEEALKDYGNRKGRSKDQLRQDDCRKVGRKGVSFHRIFHFRVFL